MLLLENGTLAVVSTGHAAANVRTFYSNPLTVKLAGRAAQMFENDRDELGGDSYFQQIGFLIPLEEGSLAAGRHVLEMERQHGVEVSEFMLEDIEELAPRFNLQGVVSGIYEPRSDYADLVRTTQSLVERAKDWGLVAYEGVAATGIRLQSDRVAAVETEEWTANTQVVVNAAAALGPLGRTVGQQELLDPMESRDRLGIMAGLRLRYFTVTADPGLRIYFHSLGDDKIMAGLDGPKDVEPMDIDNHDPNLDPDTRHRIEQGLFQWIPSLRNADFVHGWCHCSS